MLDINELKFDEKGLIPAVVVGGIGIFLRILLRTTGQRRKARQELIRKK